MEALVNSGICMFNVTPTPETRQGSTKTLKLSAHLLRNHQACYVGDKNMS